MSIWTAVHGLANGEDVEADILNRPTWELRERTDYLYNLLNQYSGSNPFEAIRISDLEIDTEEETPQVKDIVYIDPETHKLKKAIATIDIFSNIFSSASTHSLAIGVLTELTGTSGTVVIGGRVYLSDIGGAWATSDMLETDEVFRAGHYYLSSTEAGKLTANPKGPAIYIGQFLAQTANPNLLDYSILQPQYKDIAESHIHKTIALKTQPAGSHVYTDHPLTGTHTVNGFMPQSDEDVSDGAHTGADAAAVLTDSGAAFGVDNLIGLVLYNITNGTSSPITGNTATTITTVDGLNWDNGDSYKISVRNRLVVTGDWNSSEDIQYIITLASLDVANPPNSNSLFDNVYLHWESSDPNEGTGYTRLRSYETSVPVGTKGLMASLENILNNWTTVESCDVKRRRWVIDAPTQVQGWLANKQRLRFTSNWVGTDRKYSVLLFGGPYTSISDQSIDTLTVRAARLYRLTYASTVPSDGETVTIGSTVLEFDDNNTLTNPDHIKVSIVTGDAEATFKELLQVINTTFIPGATAVINTVAKHVIIGVADSDTVAGTPGGYTFTEVVTAGPWTIGAANGLLVHDGEYNALVPTDSYWASSIDYWEPKLLRTGVYLMFIPYDAVLDPKVDDVITNGDYWVGTVINEASGSEFIYNVGTHNELNTVYPPIPFDTAVITLNGIELDNKALFPDSNVYSIGNSGIYWYSKNINNVPWPQDWESVDVPGSPEFTQRMLFNNVRMAIGDSSTVTSLKAGNGSPIRLRQCGTTDEASTGNLEIDLDLQLAEDDTDLEGYRVFKQARGNRLVKGPVVSMIEAGPGISVTSPPGVPQGRGRVRVGLSSGAGSGGNFEDVALENAKQEMIGLYPYVKLLGWETGGQNINTGFVCKFKVPIDVTGNYKVAVYFTLFGLEDIPTPSGVTPQLKYAGLEFYYSILHDYMTPTQLNPYDNLIDDLITPPAAQTISVPIGAVGDPTYIYKAYDPVIIHNNPSEPITTNRRISQVLGSPIPTSDALQHGVVIDPALAYVTAGSLVAVRVRRAGVSTPATEYTGPLGFINMHWRIIQG